MDTVRSKMRETVQIHGPHAWRNRAVWAMLVYSFGRWSDARKSRAMRWLTSKIYSILSLLSEILTGMTLYRSMEPPGEGFHIIHPTGIYLHPGVKIGARVGIMHNVTLGTNMRSTEDVPVIGDDVFIGCGATILGKVKIGDGARIAANSLVINNVPEGCFAVGVPAKNIKMPSVRQQETKRQEAKQQEAATQESNGHRDDAASSSGADT